MMSSQETDNATSHKGLKRQNHTMNFKIEAVQYAEENSNCQAASKFNVDTN